MQAKYKYPYEEEHKGQRVMLYQTPITPKDRETQDAYTLIFYEDGQRKRKLVVGETKAHDEADVILKRLAEKAKGRTVLTGDEAHNYNQALAELAESGVPLAEACKQFARAWKISSGHVVEAASFYSERSDDAVIEGVTLPAAIDEFLKTKEKDVSPHFYREYSCKLTQLKTNSIIGPYPIATITTKMLDNYLRDLDVEKRTRQNARSVLRTFFSWARTVKYVPKDFNFDAGVADVDGIKLKAVQILKPAELEKLLAKAPTELVPFIAIQAFAGLRHAEVTKLDWSEINLRRDGEIDISAANAKEDVRRTVPVLPCLRKWLKPYAKESGPVTPRSDMTKGLLKLAEEAGIAWKRNALRKSFISYRVKQVKSLDQVALEAGNSVRIIQRHYLRVAKVKQDAAKWFNVAPGNGIKNVVQLPQQAEAAAV